MAQLEPEDKILVDREEYDKLLEDSEFLDRLYAAGVDNWEGYENACSSEEE